MSNPPTYEEALAQLTQLQSKPLPPSVQAVAQQAMAEKMADPQTATDLLTEVQGLSDSVIKIDAAFERVKQDLGKVDDNNYLDKNGQPIPKLQPTWIGYQQRFIMLLWDSRATATGTEAYVRDFLEIIIPEVEAVTNDDQYKDAVADLKEFINRTDPYGGKLNSGETSANGQKFSQAFTDLRRDISAFRDSFDTFAADQKAKLSDQINYLRGEIERLNAEIAKCQTIVAAMGIALGVTVFATAAGAVAALAACGPLGPVVAIGVVIFGAAAAIAELSTLIAYIVKANEYRSERDDDQRQLDDLQQQLATLEQLQTLLKSQDADINDICGRLDQFAAIWAQVAHDAGLIASELQAAVNAADGGGTKTAFKARLELIKTSYSALADGLSEYATQIDKSGVPQPTPPPAPTPAPNVFASKAAVPPTVPASAPAGERTLPKAVNPGGPQGEHHSHHGEHHHSHHGEHHHSHHGEHHHK